MSPCSYGTRTVELFKKACEAGDAHGCSNLGVMYSSGRGVTRDDGRAVEFYRKACEAGDSNGCGNRDGDGCKRLPSAKPKGR